jgi:hypothetical protein
MANHSKNITISKRAVRQRGGLVILTLKEYQKLAEMAAPTHYLSGKEAEEVDRLVEEGLRDYRKGRIVAAPSLKAALKNGLNVSKQAPCNM